jgi:type I restriction enzyme S subunit
VLATKLWSLDKKIQLNHQTNQTLEQIAQAIFKSWFVDFEPVKAKIAAKQNGQDPELAAICAISGKSEEQLNALGEDALQQLKATAALFPDSLVDSELGEVPEGWGTGSMKDCCLRVESGGTPKRSEDSYWNGGIRWLSSGEVRDVIILDTKEKISEEGLNNSSAKLWPHGSTVVAMYGATAGQVCLLANEMTANQACCALIPKRNHQSYIFLVARRSIEDLAGKASGSAQQNLNKSLVADHKVLLPEDKVLEVFEQSTLRLLEMWIKNTEQNLMLAGLRDSLLPKLLSGEIIIEDEVRSTDDTILNSVALPVM